jgi:multimeric flavodoxin WrbA
MKIIAINGSPRKNWNTHILLEKALEGAKSAGAYTELFNLYDLDYKGCISCFACKVKNGKSLGHCAVNDGLKPVLEAIDKCDGFILGTPIYMGDITAMMRALWERLIFQYLNYDDYSKPFSIGTKKTALIYTMNAPESILEKIGYTDKFESYERTLKMYFGNSDHMVSTETLQVNDYSKYHMATFNESDRKKRREEIFPLDCEKAYELGKSIANM